MINKKLLVGAAVIAGVSATQYKTHTSPHNEFINLYTKHTNNSTNPLPIMGTTTINSPIGLWQLTAPSMNGGKITVIPNNAKVNVIGENNGWYKVIYNGITGWSYAKYTTGINHLNTSNTLETSKLNLKGEVNSDIGLWLLEAPSMQGKKIEVMPNQGEFTILGYSGNWTKVNFNGKIGYCYTEYTKTLSETTKIIGHTTITSPIGLWQLESPSFSGKQLTVIPYNTKVNVLGESNGWYKVQYNNVIGWSYAKYTSGLNSGNKVTKRVTIDDSDFIPAKNGSYGSVNSDIGLWLLNSPSMQGQKIQVLPFGAGLKVLGYSGDWTKVEYNGKVGYSYSKYISKIQSPLNVNDEITSAPIGTTMVKPMVGLWMLTSPDLKGGHIEVIPYFTQLSVYEIHNGWYKISYNGHIGWVDSAYTSFLSKNASGVLTIDMPHNENLVARMSPVNSSKVIFSIPNSTCVAAKRYVRDWVTKLLQQI